ncbi:Hypothetical protein, putative [Bodo saltans]|uniref:Uncharacterized protein n=1 Tax=Bodo saltans TaxID=75058 RepID=A0A0S4JU40_BODSA|nr:Hypothetical protein, putative [Bodo saltans]|eukprot:CUG93805.1 Hypothetical protein, putative [Bodo saltans]
MADVSATIAAISQTLLTVSHNAESLGALENCRETESLPSALRTLCVLFCIPDVPTRNLIADEAITHGIPHALSAILHSCRHRDDVLTNVLETLSFLARCGTLSDATSFLVDAQCCRQIVELLTHGNVAVMEQAARAMGNLIVADDGATMRDLILSTRCANGNCVFVQLEMMYSGTIAGLETEEERRAWKDLVGWAIAALCFGAPQPALPLLLPCFPLLVRLLSEAAPRSKCLLHAVRAVKNICLGPSDDRTLEVIKHGLMNACLNALLVLPLQLPPPMTQREHNYVQDTCVLPTEQLADVFAFVGTEPMKKIAFGCKDWFSDIVCRDGDLYDRLGRSEAMQLDGAFEGTVLRLLAMSVHSAERRREAVQQSLFFDAIERLARTTSIVDEMRKQEYGTELLFVIRHATFINKVCVNLMVARQVIEEFVVAALEHGDVGMVTHAALIVHNAVQCVDDVAEVVRNGWIHGLVVVAMRCFDDTTLKEIIISALEIFSERVALEQQTDDDDTASPSTVTLLDGGIDAWLELAASPNGNDFIGQAMTKFPEVFSSAQSYYYAILLPFGLVAWFSKGQHHQLMVRGAAELLRDAMDRRLEDLNRLPSKMIVIAT